MARVPAIELAPGVVRIPTIGAAATNSFALVDDDGSVTLVDCGVKRAPARIVAGLRAVGRHPGDVVRIVLTHAHSDHAGGAAEMAARTGSPVALHERDAPFVEAGRAPDFDPSLLVGRLMTRLPAGGFPPAAVGERLSDGQVLDVGGGLRIVATPGHTPGHVSLLHEPTATLITGDALFNVRQLRYSPRPLCTDFRLNERTAHVLGELEYERVAFTHGTEITKAPGKRCAVSWPRSAVGEAVAVAEEVSGAVRECAAPSVDVTGVRSLGRGVAVSIASPGLAALRGRLARTWAPWLTAQDRAKRDLHVTVQNKVTPGGGPRAARRTGRGVRRRTHAGGRARAVALPRRPVGARRAVRVRRGRTRPGGRFREQNARVLVMDLRHGHREPG